MKHKYTKEDLISSIRESLSIAQVCRKLNITPAGGNYRTLRQRIKKFEIDTSHFTGKAWNVGLRYKFFGKKYSMEEILIVNSEYTDSSKLRKRLISEKFKDFKCEVCLLESWLNQPISLELHHKNGINDDNRIDNLQLLCPNCHAQTHNYRGKNKK